MSHKVGIIGHGYVGMAIETGFQSIADIRIHDKFKPSESLYDVVNNSDIIFVAVPTPMNENGSCNISIVDNVCKQIDKNAEQRKSIIIKSTVPPGTTDMISWELEGRHGVMFNPEFLTEKNFIDDFLNQDRILIGCAKECTSEDVAKVLDLYDDFVRTQKKPAFIGELSSAKTVELLKYATNAFLATKVMFFNQIFDFCKAYNIQFEEVREAMTWDERIGKNHTKVPGPDGFRGVGGKCLPKDLCALISDGELRGVDVELLKTVWQRNCEIREKYDWKDIVGATTENNYGKKQ